MCDGIHDDIQSEFERKILQQSIRASKNIANCVLADYLAGQAAKKLCVRIEKRMRGREAYIARVKRMHKKRINGKRERELKLAGWTDSEIWEIM